MRRKKYSILTLLFSVLFISTVFVSCRKDEDKFFPNELTEPVNKFEALAGTWQQTDVQLGVDVDEDAGLVMGASVVKKGYLVELGLGVDGFGQAMQFSQYNVLTINEDRTYTLDNAINDAYAAFLMPGAGTKGSWDLTVQNAVLQLTPGGGGEPDPHWINGLTDSTLSLSIILSAGGNDIPLYVYYRKQTSAPEDLSDQRMGMLEGDWIQKDIQFGMTIPKDALGLKIDKGTSLMDLAPLLAIALGDPDLAQQIQLTQLNTFSFSGGNYSFSNPLDDALVSFLLPDAGTSGDVGMTALGSVVSFTGSGGSPALHEIKSISDDEVSIGIEITVPGAGTLPFNLILEKSAGESAQDKMQQLAGTWSQKDIQVAIDVPEDALGLAIPGGTSLNDLIQNPDVADELGSTAVLGIQAMAASIYSFGPNGVYSFSNPIGGSDVIEALFPDAGTDGHWGLLGGDHIVMPLIPAGGGGPFLHWINSISDDQVSIRVTLDVDGTPIPLNLILKKEDINILQREQWLAGTWMEDDLQIGVDVPADALFPGQPALPKGTSVLDLVQDPQVQAVLGAQAVGAINATQATQYTFAGDNTYTFASPVDPAIVALLFPKAGLNGDWDFVSGGTKLQLEGSSDTGEPQIADMSSDELTLSTTLSVPGGPDIPVNVVLKKQ